MPTFLSEGCLLSAVNPPDLRFFLNDRESVMKRMTSGRMWRHSVGYSPIRS